MRRFFLRKFEKPIVYVSMCLGFEPCRYDGKMCSDEFTESLKQYVEFKTVCPEMEMGLGVPRETIRIVSEKGEIKLMQPSSEKDVSKEMSTFINNFINSVDECDGFLFKSRSPSCGTKDVKIYEGMQKSASSKKGSGIFAGAIIEKFYGLAIEDDGRLKDYKIREHFLTKIFTFAKFRTIKKLKSMDALVEFHNENILLFMSYNQKLTKVLRSIITNYDKAESEKMTSNKENSEFQNIIQEYEISLKQVFLKAPRYTSNISTLIHSMGYFSEDLTQDEKEFILKTIEEYREGRVPLSVPQYIIRTEAVRFNNEYLINQSFFEPFPLELVTMRDSGKAVDRVKGD